MNLSQIDLDNKLARLRQYLTEQDCTASRLLLTFLTDFDPLTVTPRQVRSAVQATELAAQEHAEDYALSEAALRVFNVAMVGRTYQTSASFITHGKSILTFIRDHREDF